MSIRGRQIPVHRSALDLEEPLTPTERKSIAAELAQTWLDRALRRLTSEQRSAARKLLVRQNKGRPKKAPHRPARWTADALNALRKDLEEWATLGLGGTIAVRLLSRQHNISERSMRNLLSKHRITKSPRRS